MDIPFKVRDRLPGHWLRRFFHIMTALIPVVYYCYLPAIAARWNTTPQLIVLFVLGFVLIFEGMRLLFGFHVYGQRHYESRRISSAVLVFISIGFVVLFAPQVGVYGAGLGLPIICSCSLGDPLMGEARILGWRPSYVVLSGVLLVSLIWIVGVFVLATPVWIIPFMISVIVFAETVLSRWLDDNVGMLILPLILLILIY